MYEMHMDVQCGPAKNAANLLKHGVSLTEADGVLSDPLALTVEDAAADGERRWLTIGQNVWGEPRLVVWTLRPDEVRVISVRKPSPSERRAYEESL
jgi:uncharacterized protein